ncbi:hypothetical protein CEXT_137781 [Caerostris extrusa]|uniref:Uncharacterized protein n=1 Tax=Caerostris extrusa TaxID=172846 RepID=A0AAV4Y4H1_CAEEX|nr:hypothetical protein CEXT_137781 [Caerostris extrusa]
MTRLNGHCNGESYKHRQILANEQNIKGWIPVDGFATVTALKMSRFNGYCDGESGIVNHVKSRSLKYKIRESFSLSVLLHKNLMKGHRNLTLNFPQSYLRQSQGIPITTSVPPHLKFVKNTARNIAPHQSEITVICCSQRPRVHRGKSKPES